MATKEKATASNLEAAKEETEEVSVYDRSTLAFNEESRVPISHEEALSVYERSTLGFNAVEDIYDQSDSGKAIKNSDDNKPPAEESSAQKQDVESGIQSEATETNLKESSDATTAPIQHNIMGTIDLVTDSEEDDVDHLIDLMDRPDETPKRMPLPFMEPSKKM